MQELKLNQNINQLHFIHSAKNSAGGITEYHFEYAYDISAKGQLKLIPQLPLPDRPFIHLYTQIKGAGIIGQWLPDSGLRKQLIGDWTCPSEINLSHSAPVICFFDGQDKNVCTISISEVSKNVHLLAGVHEETGELTLHIVVYLSAPVNPQQLSVRFDQRSLAFGEVLKDTVYWWDALLPDAPMEIPDSARLPMYSTWYAYHQNMTDQSLTKEYETAAKMGMRGVIIDDGWQTADNNRGYGFCGDWNPETGKFPDFSLHIRKIHDLGMKCMIWYSVPFMGEYSKTWSSFENMLLHYDPVLHTGVLDPRYPAVRRYLISTYQKALKDWDLDGFKLDFIDSFHSYPDTPQWNKKMDFCEIQDAVYCLMLEISRTLKKEKPELLIEFRQNYIGPQMRRFGNIFRVGDCPMSGITNRVAITDLKLLSGSTAVHSDMIMWSADETAENAAVQLINCIFSTLQISVRLNDLTSRQKKALEHYLHFSVAYRDVLLTGTFTPSSPLGQYPVLCAQKNGIWICAVYNSRQAVRFPENSGLQEYWMLNGTAENTVFILSSGKLMGELTVFDCCGDKVSQQSSESLGSLRELTVPSGGSLRFRAANTL